MNIVVCFKVLYEGSVVVVRRGQYFGLPGDLLKDGQEIKDFTQNILNRCLVHRNDVLERAVQIGGDHHIEWDGKPAVLKIYGLSEPVSVVFLHPEKVRCIDPSHLSDGDIDITARFALEQEVNQRN